jgi:SAM-dependent methyltransferase
LKPRISQDKVTQAAQGVLSKHDAFWQEFWGQRLPRISEEISWIYTEGGTVVDLGGATGFHASVCAAMGMKAYCVDNYVLRPEDNADAPFYEQNLGVEEEIAKGFGVEFVHADLLKWEPPFSLQSIDVCMTFDNIEHLHHSPRATYRKMADCLKPGGLFLLGAPNAANLLKRVQVPLGTNIFSAFDEWYGYEHFIGHVREPVIADYYRIAKDLNLKVIGVAGRNWLGYYAGKNKRRLTRIIDHPLRNFPTLCSDIYLLAQKPS